MSEINTEAAQKYISEKRDGISASAKDALSTLEKALSDSAPDTQASLMELALAVETAQ